MKHAEDIEQQRLVSWAMYYKLPCLPHIEKGATVSDYLYAIPNGGKRNVKEAARFKTQGVKAGVSDLHFPLPLDGYSGLWIEMKQKDRKKASVSDSQQKWLERMEKAGHSVAVCYGLMKLNRLF
jgi:hypothetical protein